MAITDIEVVCDRFNVNKQLRINLPKNLPPIIDKNLSKTASIF
jgi:hypothetical protein